MMLRTLNILRRIRDDEKLQDASLGSVQKMLKEIFREWDSHSGELLNFAIAYLEKQLDSYLPLEEINAVLHKVQPGLVAKPHGFEYAITGAKTEGILPMQWRTGHIMYGYKNTPAPAGWFYVSSIELETFVMKLSAHHSTNLRRPVVQVLPLRPRTR